MERIVPIFSGWQYIKCAVGGNHRIALDRRDNKDVSETVGIVYGIKFHRARHTQLEVVSRTVRIVNFIHDPYQSEGIGHACKGYPERRMRVTAETCRTRAVLIRRHFLHRDQQWIMHIMRDYKFCI